MSDIVQVITHPAEDEIRASYTTEIENIRKEYEEKMGEIEAINSANEDAVVENWNQRLDMCVNVIELLKDRVSSRTMDGVVGLMLDVGDTMEGEGVTKNSIANPLNEALEKIAKAVGKEKEELNKLSNRKYEVGDLVTNGSNKINKYEIVDVKKEWIEKQVLVDDSYEETTFTLKNIKTGEEKEYKSDGTPWFTLLKK